MAPQRGAFGGRPTQRILGRAGTSLADIYDVDGSIIGVDELDSREVKTVHEMGGTIFSERLGFALRRQDTAAILQTATFDHVLADLPAFVTRIMGLSVFADADRVLNCCVSLRNEAGREMPIWCWDAAVDDAIVARVDDDGGGAANLILLRPVAVLENIPTMLATFQPQNVPEIAFRGTSATFGAGDVTVSLIVMLGRTDVVGEKGISSQGLPIPSW